MAKVITTLGANKKPAANTAVGSPSGLRANQSTSLTAVAKPPALSRKTEYATLVKRLAKDLGVKVAAVPAKSPSNPYRTSAAVTKKALQSAGILTRSGKLSPRLK